MGRFTGTRAVVTGGTHGMGLAIVRALLDGGAEVVLTGRNEHRVAEELAALDPARARVERSDAASLADVDRLAAAVEQRLGTVDGGFAQGIGA
ncbi:SDR family NAD(P)-dependent oxidoreductase [Jiangella sp. DSM 45060]|uniref:SDR family NAD(P)-dependent oxidoreductase n=1 Tax=Jiangella sp. DSM 45060 TaxID=1798224 RepID=UPI00087D41C6|nr:SDR family NAD(P)-dependent oxidoreductase [Jiangella sp. DSM 45060]SDS00125.1 short chain dehydrogenase [Jiangella sp. DSM 45060]